MRIGGLCSGIGGLELGLERAGVGETVWQVERDAYCRSILAHHWPDATRYEDITTTDWSTVEHADLICGGIPCQPFSQAGQRQGVDDARWLWPAARDCIEAVRPDYFVLENVAAILRADGALAEILGDLHALGFDAEWDLFPASAFGAPHCRERFILVAYPSGARLEGRLFTAPAWQAQRELPSGLGRAGMEWPLPPDTSRVGYGLPDWVDRVRATGNAVVPAVAEHIGRALLAHVAEVAA